jgi:Fibronectin type III domain
MCVDFFSCTAEPKEFPMGVRVRTRDWITVVVDWRGIMTGPQEEPIEGYKIRVWRQGEDVKEAKDQVLPLGLLDGSLYTLLGGLSPGQSYNLRVLGYSRGGDGRMSSPVWQFRMGEFSPKIPLFPLGEFSLR